MNSQTQLFALRQSCLTCFNSFLLFFPCFSNMVCTASTAMVSHGLVTIWRWWHWTPMAHEPTQRKLGKQWRILHGITTFPFPRWWFQGNFTLIWERFLFISACMSYSTYMDICIYFIDIYIYMGLYAHTIFPHDMGWKAPLFEVSGSQVVITCFCYMMLCHMCGCLGVGGHGYITSSWVSYLHFIGTVGATKRWHFQVMGCLFVIVSRWMAQRFITCHLLQKRWCRHASRPWLLVLRGWPCI